MEARAPGCRFGLKGCEETCVCRHVDVASQVMSQVLGGTLGGPRDLENRNVSYTRNTQVTSCHTRQGNNHHVKTQKTEHKHCRSQLTDRQTS